LGGDAGGGAGAQAAQEAHVDDRLDAALAAVVKRDGISVRGVGAQADEVRVLMPCGHHVELFLTAFEPAARHAAHFAGGAVAKHLVEQSYGRGHVDEFFGLRFADDQRHACKSSKRSIAQGFFPGKALKISNSKV